MHVVDCEAEPASDMVRPETDYLRVGVGLPEDRDHRRPGRDAIWVDVEHHDLGTRARDTLPCRTIRDEQPHVGMVDDQEPWKLGLRLVPLARRGTACVRRWLPECEICRLLRERPVVVQRVDRDAAVAVTRNEEPSMDAIQRPLGCGHQIL